MLGTAARVIDDAVERREDVREEARYVQLRCHCGEPLEHRSGALVWRLLARRRVLVDACDIRELGEQPREWIRSRAVDRSGRRILRLVLAVRRVLAA